MLYWHNKVKDEIKLCDFLKVVQFLDDEDLLSNTFYKHHEIYNRYKELRAYQTEKEALLNTCEEFNIGKVTFYHIKKRFKNS